MIIHSSTGPVPFLPAMPLSGVKTSHACKPTVPTAPRSLNAWNRFKKLYQPSSHSLKGKICSLSQSPSSKTLEEKTEILLEAFCSKEYSSLTKPLKKILNSLPPSEASQIIKKTVMLGFRKSQYNLLDRCLNLLSLNQLKNLAYYANKEFIDTKHAAQQMVKIFRQIEKHKFAWKKNSLNEEIVRHRPLIFNFFVNFINTITMAFNILEVGKEPGTYFETKYMLDIYWRFLTIPILIFQLLQLYFLNPLKTLGVVVVASIVGSIFFYCYVRWLKPCPQDLPNCINLTNEAKKGNIQPIFGRDAEIDALITLLSANTKTTRKSGISIARSGIGKTKLFEGLALRIAEGNVPKRFKNKIVIYLNCAKLIKSDSPFSLKDALQQILDKIGKYRDRFIICFDEVHNINTTEGHIGERFLSVLDTSSGSLPYCLAATTPEKYSQFIANGALVRRFQPIYLQELNKNDTLTVLRNQALHEAPEIEVSTEMLNAVYDLTSKEFPNEFQPSKSMHILSKTLAELKLLQKGWKFQPQLRKLNSEKEELASTFAQMQLDGTALDSKMAQDFLKNNEILDDSLKTIRQEIERQTHDYEQYKKLKKLRAHKEKAMYLLCKKIVQGCAKNKKIADSHQKLFIFTLYCGFPALDETLQSLIKEQHLKVKIDKEMIEEVIKAKIQQEIKPS